MSQKFLYVFPGAHKTATKLLQSSLEINRPYLQEEGVSVVQRQLFYRSGLLSKLKVANAIEALEPEERTRLLDEMLGGPLTDKIVISIENMFGEIGPNPYRNAEKVLNNLKALFPDYEIRVWFYTRRQDTFIESAFIQEYHTGRAIEPDAYTQKFIEHPIDWVRPLNAISKAVGPKNVRVVPYESIENGVGRYVSAFYRTFSEQNPNEMFARYKREQPFTNVSLSARGMEILKATFDVVTDRKERRQIAQLLQSAFGVDKFPPYRLPEDRMELLKKAHQELNARLVRRVRFAPGVAAYYLFEQVEQPEAEVGGQVPVTTASTP